MIARFFNPLELLKKRKSFFLFGARGTGKTHLIKCILPENSLYFDLLRTDVFSRYLTHPELFPKEIEHTLSKHSGGLVVAVDEVQRLPDLLNEVHRLIESYKGKVAFALTGSSSRKLKRGGANLLAGRAITRNLYPISSLEIELQLERALQFGTLPGIYFEEGFELPTLESYVGTYLKEEILQEALVRKLDRFSRFLDLAAQLNSEPINFSKLAKDLSSSTHTIQEYFSILSDTLIVNRIDGWHHSVRRQLLQAPKFYFFDCGVLNAINGELRTELKPTSFRYGKLFETFVTQEIIRANHYQDLGLRFNYWRDKNGAEVDLVLSRTSAKPILGVEIKSGSRITEPDLNGLRLLSQEYPTLKQWCLCTTVRPYRLGNVEVLPWESGIKFLERL